MPLLFSIHGIIVIVLDDESMERVKKNDPLEITPAWTRDLGTIRLPPEIMICYAPEAEHEALMQMEHNALMKHLTRGYQFTESDKKRGPILEAMRDLDKLPTKRKH